MKYNKLVAWGLLASLGISTLTAFGGFSEGAYTVAGFGMIIFGIWAAVLLFNDKD